MGAKAAAHVELYRNRFNKREELKKMVPCTAQAGLALLSGTTAKNF